MTLNPYDELEGADDLPAPPRQDIPYADRELLELAARALGAVRVEDVDGESWPRLHFPDGSMINGWNSLQFSGDTFDLIVRLGLQVSVQLDEHYAIASPAHQLKRGETGTFEDLAGDLFAATRRAVTRAAAELGKPMLAASPV